MDFSGILNSFTDNKLNVSMLGIMFVVCIVLTFMLWRKAKGTQSYQLRSYCATLWTSMGILFTFVSIFFSLSNLTTMGASSVKDPAFVMNLIKNIIPAFSTSIVGILGAIICTIANRWSIANDEKNEFDAFERTRQKFGVNGESDSPELILLEIVKSIKDSSSNTSNLLKGSREVRDEKLSKLIAALQALSTKISENHTQTTDTISTALELQKADFLSAVDVMSSKFEAAMSNTQQNFREEIRTLSANLEGEVRSMVNSNEKIFDKTLAIQEKQLNLVSTTLTKESEERIKQLQEFVGTQNEAFGALYTRIDEQISSHIEVETKLFKEDIKTAIEEFAKAQYETCIDSIKESNNALVESSRELIKKQESENESFVSNLSQLFSSKLEQLPNMMSTLSTKIVDKLDEIHRLEAGLIEQTINDNVVNVSNLLSANKDQIERISAVIKSDCDTLKDAISHATDQLKADTLLLESEYKKDIELISVENKNNVSAMNSTVVNIQKSIQETLNSLALQVSTAMEVFVQRNEDLKKYIVEQNTEISNDIAKQIRESISIQELEKTSDNMSKSIVAHTEELNKCLSSIVDSLKETSQAVESSSVKYKAAVDGADKINSYVEKTSDLFGQYTTALHLLDSSLRNVEIAMQKIATNLATVSETKSQSIHKSTKK